MSCDMWFGTQDYATWIQTPQRGADVSAQGWNESGNFLNGGAFAFNSFNTHKEFDFSWRTTSSRKEAQTMMSFYSGTFGRGKLYFLDPLTMKTNVLPARWADPSITCDFEGESLVPGVDPLRVSQTNTDQLQLPVTAAQYDLSGITEVETAFNAEATNLFTNPNLVGDGTYATVAENLFTNPNLVGDGTWAEVRRNLATVPGATSGNPANTRGGKLGWTARWYGSGGSGAVSYPTGVSDGPIAAISSYMRKMWTTVPTGSEDIGFSHADSALNGYPVVPGETLTWSSYARASWSEIGATRHYRHIRIKYYNTSGEQVGTYIAGPDSARAAAGEWVRLSHTSTVPASAAYAEVYVYYFTDTSRITSGATLDGTGLLVEKTSVLQPYFDGSSLQGSIDPDMRQRWLGTPNASESVMEIERVAGFTGAWRGVLGASSSTKMRAISVYPGSSTLLQGLSMPGLLPGSTYTVISTITNKSDLSLTKVRPPYPRVTSGNMLAQDVSLSGNETKTFRQVFTIPADSPYSGVLGVGIEQQVPQGTEIVVEAVGLFAGDYQGEVFSGNTTPETAGGVDQPEDFRWRWLGAENASESVMEIERVAGVTATNCVAGVSTLNDKPAARLIPTTASNNSFISVTMPTEARAHGTVLGTSYLSAPITGTIDARGWVGGIRTFQPDTFSTRPNTAGTVLVRHEVTDMTSDFAVRWMHGGAQGSGDVWWTDIGLFAGEYDGTAFSGDSEVPGKVTRWAGTPNASPSELGHLTLSTPSVISDSNALFVPLPDGMQLNVGAFYQSTTAGQGVYVTPATRGGGNTGVVTRLTPLTPSAADTLPNTFTKTPGVIGVWVWIGKTDQGPGVVTVNAIHARVSPLGSTSTGEAHWYGGQGNEGVRFLQPPTYINNTGRDGGQIEFAATFTEVSF